MKINRKIFNSILIVFLMPFAFSLYVGSTLNPILTYEYFFKTTADDYIESGQVVWCKSNLKTLESYAVVKESLQNKKTTYLYYERRFGGDELFYEYLNNSFKESIRMFNGLDVLYSSSPLLEDGTVNPSTLTKFSGLLSTERSTSLDSQVAYNSLKNATEICSNWYYSNH